MDAVRGLSFEVVEPVRAVDPARMDVAMFVGLVDGLEPGRPVVVQSSDDLAALGASSTRLDRIAAVTGAALPDPLVLDPATRSLPSSSMASSGASSSRRTRCRWTTCRPS